jgi:hypothetical protein
LAKAERPGDSRSRFEIHPVVRVAFALLLLACQAPPTTPIPPKSGEVCADLAYVFLLVAEEKDRGSTKEAQIEMMRETVDNPFVSRPNETLRHLLQVVDLVYGRSDATAREIEAIVLDDCVVDEQRRAVLTTNWTTR